MTKLLLFPLALAILAGCGTSEAATDPETGPDTTGTRPPDPIVVPARASAALLDIAGWNVEWFGSAGNGPTDETLQFARVRDVITGTDADIWGMVEVVDAAAWRALDELLPGYEAVLASDASVTGGSAAYHSGEQKVGILYKPGVAVLQGARVILAEHDRAFAGRPPLEARFRVTIDGSAQDLVVIVLHMKAFADEESRQRRQAAGEALKAYLDAAWPAERVIVVGDWNDDVDTSITPSQPTPYVAFVADSADYRFVTAPLSAQRISSTTGYPDLIDHHLATNELVARLAGAAEVYDLGALIPRYDETVSDHFPVISHYRP